MIVRFIVSNYKSFKEPVEINFLAGNYKRHESHVVNACDLNLLRSSALYGNNGSGKTNLFLALDFLYDIVCFESDPDDPIEIPVFKLDSACTSKPTQFEIEFIVNDTMYSYSATFKNNQVTEEWLYKLKGENKYDVIFERKVENGKSKIKLGQKKKLTQKEKHRREFYAEDLQPQELFFHKASIKELKEFKEFKEPYSWFTDKLNVIRLNAEYKGLAFYLGTDDEFSKLAQKLICGSDLGIEKIEVLKVPIHDFFGVSDETRKNDIIKRLESYDGVDFNNDNEEYSSYKDDNDEIVVAKIITYRKSINGELISFKLSEESAGTKRLFNLIPAVINALMSDGVYIIDEIESSFHPILIKGILKLYLEAKNSHRGQILFSTHECNLLDLELLRQDEIWFAEKNEDGSTKLSSLSDFKPRFDKDVRKGYLEGQFSKIPFLGNIKDLNWEQYA